MRVFWAAFSGMFVYEILPSYIFPLLNGFNIFCFASQHASTNVQNVFTNLFGGAEGNEGLGFLSLRYVRLPMQPLFDTLTRPLQFRLAVHRFHVRLNPSIKHVYLTWRSSYMSLPLIQQGERIILLIYFALQLNYITANSWVRIVRWFRWSCSYHINERQ